MTNGRAAWCGPEPARVPRSADARAARANTTIWPCRKGPEISYQGPITPQTADNSLPAGRLAVTAATSGSRNIGQEFELPAAADAHAAIEARATVGKTLLTVPR